MQSKTLPFLGRGLLISAAYFLSAKLGLSLAFVHSAVTAVWPPTGIALACLLLFGVRMWPAIALGAFAINFVTLHSAPAALGIAVGNTLEGVLGATLVQRSGGIKSLFAHSSKLFRFLVYACALAAIVSATIGSASLCVNGLAAWANYPRLWITWWLGDTAGGIVVAPLLLAWAMPAVALPNWKKGAEATLLLLVLAISSQIVFGGWIPAVAHGYPIEFLCLPPLLWAAFRFGVRGAASAICLSGALAVIGTIRGLGPFAYGSPNTSLLLLQVFIALNAVVSLVIAALICEREAATERLMRSNTELESFASLTSHDLKEPLRTISIFSELLQRDHSARLDNDGNEYLTLITGAAKRMHKLVGALLDYARLGRSVTLSPTDCSTVLRKAVSNLEGLLRETQGQIAYDEMPVLRSNPEHLERLFQNLISNSLKYHGKTPPLVKIGAERQGNEWLIRVSDNGVGIPQEYLERVFKPFARIGEKRQDGTGLGLAACKRIVEEHGGQIGLTSCPGVGSTFFFTLPAT